VVARTPQSSAGKTQAASHKLEYKAVRPAAKMQKLKQDRDDNKENESQLDQQTSRVSCE
jgi:hypothetical protein